MLKKMGCFRGEPSQTPRGSREPVHGIVRVLEKVRRFSSGQPVGMRVVRNGDICFSKFSFVRVWQNATASGNSYWRQRSGTRAQTFFIPKTIIRSGKESKETLATRDKQAALEVYI